MPWVRGYWQKARWVPGHFEGLRWVKGYRQPRRYVKGYWSPKEEPVLTFLLAIFLLILIAGLAG
jgi:hypothetical protein